MIPDFCSDYLLWASTVLVKLPFFLLAPPWEKQGMFGFPEILNFNLSSFQVSCGVPSRGIGCGRSKTGPWNTCMLWPFGVFIGFWPHFSMIKFQGKSKVETMPKSHISWPEMDILSWNISFDPWSHELKHVDRQSNRHRVTWGCEQLYSDLCGRSKRNIDKHGCTEAIPPTNTNRSLITSRKTEATNT